MEEEVPGKGEEEEEGYGKKTALYLPGRKGHKDKNKDSGSGKCMEVYALNKKKAYNEDNVKRNLKAG